MADDDGVKKLTAWLGVVAGLIGLLAFFGINNFGQLRNAVATPTATLGTVTVAPLPLTTTTNPLTVPCRRFRDAMNAFTAAPAGSDAAARRTADEAFARQLRAIAGTAPTPLAADLTTLANDWDQEGRDDSRGLAGTAAFVADVDRELSDNKRVVGDCD